MNRYKTLTARLSPMNLALGLSILITCLWVFWGVMQMFHEGWYAPFEWAYFLVPAAAMLCLSLVSLRWPRCGAILFVITGVGFGALVLWRFGSGNDLSAGWTIGALLSCSPVTVPLRNDGNSQRLAAWAFAVCRRLKNDRRPCSRPNIQRTLSEWEQGVQ